MRGERYAPRFVRRARVRALFGDLRRTESLSEWGFDRGNPVDRWYIERLLDERADLVRGRALEVDNDRYSSRYGATSVDLIDIDPTNTGATIIGDLCDPRALPAATYDVALVTQTLQLVTDPAGAVRHLSAALRPGGALLLTVPTLSRLANREDRWRWTPTGFRDLLVEAAPPGAAVESIGFGNGLAARAFLFGLAAEDLDEDVLARVDDRFPLVVGGLVRLAA